MSAIALAAFAGSHSAINPELYPGPSTLGEEDAGSLFGRDANFMAALTKIRLVRRRRTRVPARFPRSIAYDSAISIEIAARGIARMPGHLGKLVWLKIITR